MLSKRDLLATIFVGSAVGAPLPAPAIDDITMGYGGSYPDERKMVLQAVFQTTRKTWQAYYCDKTASTQLWMDVSFAEAMLLEPLLGKATITVPLKD